MWAPRKASISDSGSAKDQEESTMSSAKVKNPGRRYAEIIKLKPEHVEEYKKVHAAVWPEVLKQIKDCKMEDCRCLFSCFLLLLVVCLVIALAVSRLEAPD
jgi:hypothetical protein